METIGWEKNTHGKYLSLIGGRKSHQSSTRERSYVLFRFLIVSWKDPSTSKCQRILEEQDRNGSQLLKATEDYDGISGEPTEFEWKHFSQDSQSCSSMVRSTDLLSRIRRKHQQIFTGRILVYVYVSTTFSCGNERTMKESAWQMLKSSSLYTQRSLV